MDKKSVNKKESPAMKNAGEETPVVGKTYMAEGMMEWVALIPAYHQVLKVHFTGGTISGYGCKPATFYTEDEVLQRLIEKSRYYNHRIKLYE